MEFIHTRDLNPIINSPRETREIPKSEMFHIRNTKKLHSSGEEEKHKGHKINNDPKNTCEMCKEKGRNEHQRRHPTDKCFIYKIDHNNEIVKLSKEERQEKMSKNRQSPNPNKTERERKKSFLQTVSKQKDEDTSHKQER